MSCISEIMDAAKRAGIDILEDEAKEIEQVLSERLAKKVAESGEDARLDVFKLAREIAKQARINAAIQRKTRLLNARAYTNIMLRINANKDNPGEALSAILVGDIKTLENGLSSVDARQQAIGAEYAGRLVAALRDQDLEDIFKSGDLDELIYKAMFDGPDQLDGSTASKNAIKIAEIVKKVQKQLLKRKNRNGAIITELENYVVRQSHDAVLLRKVGKQAWISKIKDKLSAKTFENKPAFKDGQPYTENDFLGDIYDNLVSGNHQKTDGSDMSKEMIDSLTAYKGPSNLAKKLSTSRVLHFKDGQASYDYSKEFSRMSFSEAVVNGIINDGQSIGLMETFGTNPKAMFERVMKDIENINKGNEKALSSINKFSLENQFKELDGTTRARGSGKLYFGGVVDFAGIGAAIRMIQNMAKLGAATISSFSDVATKAAFINSRTDRGIFGSYAKAFSDIFRGYNSKDQKKLAYLLNVGIDNFLGEVHARFGSNDSLPGFIGKAHQTFFRLNGMQWWNNAQKTGLVRMMAADLAQYTDRAFADIPIKTRTNLTRYGIGELEWSLYSQMQKTAVDNVNYLTPSAVDTIPANVIERAALDKANSLRKRKKKQATQTEIDSYKDELVTKLSTFFNDAADSAIPTPGAKERAIMNLGTMRGTILGEAVRAIMQLKGFPITYITKGMKQQYYAQKQIGNSGILGLSQMMVGTTVMGYLSMSLKDILKGRNPAEVFDEREGLNTKTFIRAFTQGGGAGIYGDFIFGEFNRYGQSPIETFAGPTLGTAGDMLKLFANLRDGNTDKVTQQAFRSIVSNTPYINLFYTKAALDYMFIYGIMEKTNPGYLRRMERRMKNDFDQEFYLPPSRYAKETIIEKAID